MEEDMGDFKLRRTSLYIEIIYRRSWFSSPPVSAVSSQVVLTLNARL